MRTALFILLAIVAGLLLQAIDRLDGVYGINPTKPPPPTKTPYRRHTAALKAIAEKPYLQEDARRLEYQLTLCREQIRRTACNPRTASASRLKAYAAAVKAQDATQARLDRIHARLDYIDALEEDTPV